MKKYKMIVFRSISCLLCLFFFAQDMQAQKRKRKEKPDTLSALRDFVAVSAGYKQVPMYLDLEMRNTTNFITKEEDTVTIQAEFFLGTENSYVRFGEFEQIVNDSMALLVSNKAQAMILYADAAPLVRQMRAMMGAALPDSSLRKLSERYTAVNQPGEGTHSAIELTSRVTVKDGLAKELIRVEYDAKTMLPLQMTTTKRVLLPLEPLQYDAYNKDAALSGSLFMLDGAHFFIKEQTAVFLYRQLRKDDMMKAPVMVRDRLEKGEEGEYRPVASYAGYNLHKMAGKK